MRDQIERVLRGWDAHERGRGTPVIDFDLSSFTAEVTPLDRITTLEKLTQLSRITADDGLSARLTSDITYLRALLGERLPLDQYIRQTQGCTAAGWQPDYVEKKGEQAQCELAQLGVKWGPDTENELNEAEGPLTLDAAIHTMRDAIDEYLPRVRELVGVNVDLNVNIETDNVDAYWSYWADGTGNAIRLRLNTRRARFSKARARYFALHEGVAHGLQMASFAHQATTTNVSWVRFLSVHSLYLVAIEGIAQALPLFIAADEPHLVARTRLDHYLKLVHAELFLMINAGKSPEECISHARGRVPFWSGSDIADLLADRSVNPLLRSYLWAYPAGIDWFVNLADQRPANTERILRDVYNTPLTPTQLEKAWPDGPTIGGNANTVHLRDIAIP
ncbi:MAG: hypothetical protein HOQ05_05580 [Corynebacteriales bacterium]|nr:hypothetical protein [Mycobacteriales bacterium]